MLDMSAAATIGGVLADVVWGVCLGLMTGLSLRAWRRMDRAAWVPLQWGRDGQPTMRAQRSLAVAFTPLAAAVGGLMLAAGERMAGEATYGWMLVRLLAPVLIVIAHRAHLRGALLTLKVEGGLRR